MIPLVAAMVLTAAPTKLEVVRVDLLDGLEISGRVMPSTGPLVIFLKVPASWLKGGQLIEARKAQVLAKMYGPTWQSGNDDGSRYVVKSWASKALSAEEVKAKPWASISKSIWFYGAKGEELEKLTPESF
jgi:hypothetical protein